MWERVSWGYTIKIGKYRVLVSTREIQFSLKLKQVHGAKVVIYKGQTEDIGDGVISKPQNITLGVKTADCYPIFLISDNAFGVLHAGWRGSIKGIVLEGLRILYEEFDTDPSDITAIFGPGICGKCYEVKDDVASMFKKGVIGENGRYYLDLYEFNKDVLLNLGVKDIIPPPSCTYEDPSLFSHRRGDKLRIYNAITYQP